MRVLYISILILVLDQISKLAVKGISIPAIGLELKGMLLNESIPVIGDALQLTFIENPNMAFGLAIGGKLFLSIFTLAATVALVAYLYHLRRDRLPVRIALALILGGACGNLIDRIFYGVFYGYAPFFYGNVVDFVDLNLFTINWGDFHFKFWPIFNVADSAVSLGVLLMLLFYKPHHPVRTAISPAGEAPSESVSDGQRTPPDRDTKYPSPSA